MSNIRIVFPIDFKKQADIATHYAKYFCKGLNAEIHLIHVIDEPGIITKLIRTSAQIVKIDTEIKKLLDQYADELYPYSIKVITKILYGKVYQKIEEYCNEIKPLFVIIGKTEEPSVKRKLIGSNTRHIIQEIEPAVITIRGKKKIDIANTNRDILLPLDLMKESSNQICEAIQMAKLFKSKIQILSILRTESAYKRTEIIVRLNKVKEFIRLKEVNVDAILVDDTETPIWKIVNEQAEITDSHLIIIFTREENRFNEIILGSNAQKIIDYSNLPVLSCVPSKERIDVFDKRYDPAGIYTQDDTQKEK